MPQILPLFHLDANLEHNEPMGYFVKSIAKNIEMYLYSQIAKGIDLSSLYMEAMQNE